MNIVGEGFDKEIINQIDIRQKKYGSGFNNNRTYEDLIYLNNRTAWVKLVSSTVITGSVNYPSVNNIIKQTGITGDELAEKFILFNGTATQNHISSNYDGKQRGGIDSTPSPNNLAENYAYGIGGSEFGIKPMPGIESVSVSFKNRGSIKTAIVKLKAYNKVQFEIIDVLYLRVGFTVFLEWGNTIYYKNTGELVRNPNDSLAKDFLNNSGGGYKIILNKIAKNRQKSNGNYDAMFGKVTNFHWSFDSEGNYNITLDLISYGDVVESFKINSSLATSPSGSKPLPNILQTADPRINLKKDEHLVGEILYEYAYRIKGPGKTTSLYPYIDSAGNNQIAKVSNIWFAPSSKTLDPYNQSYIRLGKFLEEIENRIMYRQKSKNSTFKGDPILNFDTDIENNLCYTPFIDFTNYPKINSITNTPNQILMTHCSYDPYTCLVFNYYSDKNFTSNTYPTNPGVLGMALPLQQSTTFGEDQSGFISPGTAPKGLEDLYEGYYKGDWPFPTTYWIKEVGSGKDTKYYGKIMNIFVNMSFILDKMEELKDPSTGKVALIDFIQQILDAISEALGNVNELELVIDENTNTAKIIDKNLNKGNLALLDKFNLNTGLANFQLYGYDNKTKSESTFITDFQFTTELSPEFSTMITVAASSNNDVVGEDATALSKLNYGLYDRYKETITEYLVSESILVTSGTYSRPKYRFMKAAYNILEQTTNNVVYVSRGVSYLPNANPSPPEINSFYTFLCSLYSIDTGKNIAYWNKEAIEVWKAKAKTVFKTFYQMKEEGINIEDQETNFTGFIPFNLSLTMDGLSGMKIYQKFTVQTDFLPSNYPKTMEFLIKNITHTIDNKNTWTTKIESFGTSRSKS